MVKFREVFYRAGEVMYAFIRRWLQYDLQDCSEICWEVLSFGRHDDRVKEE